jgi:hypothetical protein
MNRAARPTHLGGICAGAGAVQVIAAAVAFTFLGKLGLMYESLGTKLPRLTELLLTGSGAPAWGTLLALAAALLWAAKFGSNRARSIVILTAVGTSGVLGLVAPIIALLPVLNQ